MAQFLSYQNVTSHEMKWEPLAPYATDLSPGMCWLLSFHAEYELY